MNGKTLALLLAGTSPLLCLTGCKSREEAAKQTLQESGYDLTPEAFFRAAETDDLTALEKLVTSGIAVDTRNEAGDTALHAAAGAGAKKAADFLLDRKVPVDVTGAEDRTPLMVAVMRGTPEMVRYLLSQKADAHRRDAHGFKPLMLAVKEGRGDMVGELAPYDRDKLDDALLVASLEGKASVIDALTNYGASIYARMEDGRTPLMLAAENGHIEAVDMLLEVGANRFSMDDDGRIAADMAREAGHEELALRLAEAPAEDEFALEEPVDLGAEMLAKVTEKEAAAASSGTPATPTAPGETTGLPWNKPVAGQPAGSAPALLEGVVLEPVARQRVEVSAGEKSIAPLVMRAYRQKDLPMRVESVQGQTATLRMSGGGVQEITEGATIPGSRLKVVRVDSRVQDLKDQPDQVEVSVVEIEDPATGRKRELISGVEPTAHDPVALVEDGQGRHFVAKAGQRFSASDGTEYVVTDVRPNQMVIENRGTGEVITVPLRGPRG
ncbi:ankyrin repeat domain-containing protein [Luteolibacter flavescens]|uniref:Ankyrin repeat domain-containing protein n=1 Tax=Luteolibacter flavescens TaxID=1859460 RepID=A0ABT3FRB8_9BACT|nr:ankyrin repeat domain-containing protein [Luteolibacter flavescens]MCW1886097.1 ankyrin repeat domain-containing protein [Luteolibacter flavescens]